MSPMRPAVHLEALPIDLGRLPTRVWAVSVDRHWIHTWIWSSSGSSGQRSASRNGPSLKASSKSFHTLSAAGGAEPVEGAGRHLRLRALSGRWWVPGGEGKCGGLSRTNVRCVPGLSDAYSCDARRMRWVSQVGSAPGASPHLPGWRRAVLSR